MQQPYYRLTAGRAVGNSFQMFFRHIGAVAAITLLLVGLPSFFSGSLLSNFTSMIQDMSSWYGGSIYGDAFGAYGMDPWGFSPYGGLELSALFARMGAAWMISLASAVVLTPLCLGALIIVYSRSVIQKPTSFQLAMRFSGKRLGRLIVLGLCWILTGLGFAVAIFAVVVIAVLFITMIAAVAGAVGILLAVLAGIALFAAAVIAVCALQMAQSLSFAAAMNENQWGFKAIGRGFALSVKRFWSFLGANLLLSLSMIGITLIPSIALSVWVGIGAYTGTAGSATTMVFSVFTALTAAFSQGLTSALGVQYYFAVRHEFEGWQPMTVEDPPEAAAPREPLSPGYAPEAPAPEVNLEPEATPENAPEGDPVAEENKSDIE